MTTYVNNRRSVAGRVFVPVFRPFPVWTFGDTFDFEGRVTGKGWSPSWYGQRDATPEEIAEALAAGRLQPWQVPSAHRAPTEEQR